MAALGGGEAAGPAPPTLEREKQASGTATLTPACLYACFCRGSAPDMQWVWQLAQGVLELCFSTAIRGGSCTPAGSREGGASCRRGCAPQWVPVLSAGDVLQLPLPLRGAGLLPGPGAAAAGSHRWHPTHVHSQGKGRRLLGNMDRSAGPHLFRAV